MSKKMATGDFFPLQVNYEEKMYAIGKIPGGFVKREGRPKDKEILVAQLAASQVAQTTQLENYIDTKLAATTPAA